MSEGSTSGIENLKGEERSYPVPADETARLEALRELAILDTDPESEFDRITRLARILFGTQVAAISLVDEHRQWFKSITGLHAEETPRDQAFCARTILDDKSLVVLNAEIDERFAHNPLVTGAPGIRFYAGAPLYTDSGAKVGSLCIIDSKVRKNWSTVEDSLLKDLAGLVSNVFKARQKEREHQETKQELQALRSESSSNPLNLDTLTGLPDRRSLDAVLTRAKGAADIADRFLALIYIDLDRIAAVNDTYGEAAGDEVLRVLASRFKHAFRSNDIVLRIAGDQFCVVLQGLELTSGVDRPIQKLLQSATASVHVPDVGKISITVSAGVAFYPHCGSTIVDLVKEAKDAMLLAKDNGGNICAVAIRGKEPTFISAQE